MWNIGLYMLCLFLFCLAGFRLWSNWKNDPYKSLSKAEREKRELEDWCDRQW